MFKVFLTEIKHHISLRIAQVNQFIRSTTPGPSVKVQVPLDQMWHDAGSALGYGKEQALDQITPDAGSACR